MNLRSDGKQILLHGMAMILAGLLWGFAPTFTPFPRLAVGAHVQLEMHGILFMVLAAVLLGLSHSVGAKAVRTMLVTVWLTWFMALTEIANAWWGANQLLSVAAKQAGAVGAAPWQEALVKLSHVPAGLGLILSFALLIAGFVKHREPAT